MNLPNVFQNKNIKENDNVQEFYYKKKDVNEIPSRSLSNVNIESRLRSLFQSTNYVYKIDVTIVLDDKTINTTLIGKNSKYLITYNNELIPIANIKDIYERK